MLINYYESRWRLLHSVPFVRNSLLFSQSFVAVISFRLQAGLFWRMFVFSSIRPGFDYSSNPSSLNSSMESLAKRSGKRGLKNSIGKIFSSKSKLRSKETNAILDRTLLNSDHDGHRDTERRIKQKLLEDVIHSRTPFSSWNAPTILAWLEVGLWSVVWHLLELLNRLVRKS